MIYYFKKHLSCNQIGSGTWISPAKTLNSGKFFYFYVSFTDIIFTGQALAANSQFSVIVWSCDFKV